MPFSTSGPEALKAEGLAMGALHSLLLDIQYSLYSQIHQQIYIPFRNQCSCGLL